jgi:HAD superfamily hydrolase (TIGR01490 family)
MTAYVDFASAPWRDRSPRELDGAMQRFLREVMQPQLHPAAVALVQQHQARGDLIAIVTATNDFVTRPIAGLFGVDTLIATDLARDAQGRATGTIQGVPAFREGKIERVAAWLESRGQTLASFERSTFYSDSINDLPLLECVSHPVATNPGPSLLRVAQERHWPVLNLFNP